MPRKKKVHPLPWKHVAEGKAMSAIVDAKGVLICGSLICREYDTMVRNTHEFIVKSMNSEYNSFMPVGIDCEVIK